MIEKMTPQPFPLWAVEHGESTEVLVVGWLSGDGGRSLSPVILELGRPGASPYGAAVECAFYADRATAQDAARDNLRAPRRR